MSHHKKVPFYALNLEKLNSIITTELNEAEKANSYRAAQVCDWVYKKEVFDFAEMSNLSKTLREQLDKTFSLDLPVVLKESLSTDGTKKVLLQLSDKSLIEMVIIPDKEKTTLCISSQVGCARRCGFCATAELGLTRNLKTGEIVGQFVVAKRIAGERKITNLVLMGMGEPLDNYENVIKAIRIIQDDRMLSFSPRRITLSTCGVVPGILQLAEDGIKVKLAVSLNSANQNKREKIMPVARQHPLPALKKALLTYQRNSTFRITFEYVMINGFNTTREDAKQLMSYLGDISSKVNLISWNACDSIPDLKPPAEDEIQRFISYLTPFSKAVTYRKSRGTDITAACGQLTAEHTPPAKKEFKRPSSAPVKRPKKF